MINILLDKTLISENYVFFGRNNRSKVGYNTDLIGIQAMI